MKTLVDFDFKILEESEIKTLTSTDKIDEFIKCAEDPIYFIANYCYVRHPSKGKIRMGETLYKKQIDLINTVHKERFTITSKTRQCGASTVLGLYALWKGLFTENIDICIISRKDSEAKNFKKRYIDFPYNELPQFLKNTKGKGRRLKESTHVREFDSGSSIVCEAGADAGRGGTYAFIILDEAGFIPHIENVWAAIFPTLNVGQGKGVVNSTSTAIGTWYSNQWHDAVEDRNDFIPVTIDWFDVPHFAVEGDKWLKKQERNLTPHSKFRREVLREFISEGETFIPENFIRAMREDQPIRTDFLKNSNVLSQEEIHKALDLPDDFGPDAGYIKGFWVWADPVKNHRYIISADCADGRSGGKDYSAFHVIDIDTMEQVAEYQNIVDTFKYAHILYIVGTFYNNSSIIIEYNNMGVSVFNKIDIDLKYENLYFRKGGKPGWYTTNQNRDQVLSSLFRMLTSEKDRIKTHSKRLKQEIRNFITVNGKVQAAQGTNDDLVMAFAMGSHLIEETAMMSQMYDIQYEYEDPLRDDDRNSLTKQTTSEMKKIIESNIDYEININDYEQIKWLL